MHVQSYRHEVFVFYLSMPGHYQHGILCRAVCVPGGGPPIPAGRVRGRYEDAGTLLFLSTASQRLCNYEVYHSESELAMGPFHQRWAYLGEVGLLYPEAMGVVMVTTATCERLCGGGWPFYMIYSFKSFNGGVDVYVKKAYSMPADRFAVYHVDADAPDLWWRARQLDFRGYVHMPDWAEHLHSRM